MRHVRRWQRRRLPLVTVDLLAAFGESTEIFIDFASGQTLSELGRPVNKMAYAAIALWLTTVALPMGES